MAGSPRRLKESPSQTAGPYVHIGLTPNAAGVRGIYASDPGASMLTPDTPGERIEVVVRVIDGAGQPVTDAVVEVWQAGADGSYGGSMAPASNSMPSFTGWGRQATDSQGMASFATVKPGRAAGPDKVPMAPHLSLWIVARGINIGLQTRLYFDDESAANADDRILGQVPAERRATLIARRVASATPRYALDIHLQGDRETVFFDF